jgi:hypothetical protein
MSADDLVNQFGRRKRRPPARISDKIRALNQGLNLFARPCD